MGEVSVALYGAWRLMRFDPDGINYFLTSRDAFWKSFYAVIICLPGLAVLELASGDGTTPPLIAVLRFSLAFFVGLLIMAILIQVICEAIDRQQYFARCIIAINWSSVLKVYVIAAIMLFRTAAPDSGIGGLLYFTASLFLMVYEGFIFHRSLEVTGFAAAGFVALGVTVSLFLQSLIATS